MSDGTSRGDTEGAARLVEQLRRLIDRLGADHPAASASLDPVLATVLHNLAHRYHDQTRYAEAEILYKWSASIRSSVLGREHPDVGIVLHNLGELFRQQRRHQEALDFYRSALRILERGLGSQHPDVAAALHNLGRLHHELEQYAEAESLYERALAIREATLDPDHPHTAATLHDLADLPEWRTRSCVQGSRWRGPTRG